MTNEYDVQVEEFLKKTNAEVIVKFSRKGKYFPDDRDERDIYDVTIRRRRGLNDIREMTFTFGNSIANTGMYSDYITGRKAQKRVAPSPYSILACLEKYPVGDFYDFVSEYGYSLDTRKEYHNAVKTHIAVREEYDNVMRVFGDVIEDLREIQ